MLILVIMSPKDDLLKSFEICMAIIAQFLPLVNPFCNFSFEKMQFFYFELVKLSIFS